MWRLWHAIGTGIVILGVSARASANPADLWGWGSESIARAGAVTASTHGPEAAFYNPAGLAWAPRLKVEASYLHAFSNLHYQTSQGDFDRNIPMADFLGMGMVWPILPWLSVGMVAYLPMQAALRIDQQSADAPYFPFLENRSQRLSLFPAVGLRLKHWLAIGVGLNFFSDVSGDIATSEGPTRASESTIVADASSRAAFIAGISVHTCSWLNVAVVYRQAFAVPYAITTRNLVGGTPLDVSVKGDALPTPHELIIGSALSFKPLSINLDMAWRMWHLVSNPFVDVDAVVSGLDLGLRVPSTPYRDTLALRSSAVVQHQISQNVLADYRFGAGLETSQVKDQAGRTNLIDAPKLLVSTGVGFNFPTLLSLPVHIDLHASLLYQVSRRYDKKVSAVQDARDDPNVLADEDSDTAGIQISNPGYPYLIGEAFALSMGITIGLEFPP